MATNNPSDTFKRSILGDTWQDNQGDFRYRRVPRANFAYWSTKGWQLYSYDSRDGKDQCIIRLHKSEVAA